MGWILRRNTNDIFLTKFLLFLIVFVKIFIEHFRNLYGRCQQIKWNNVMICIKSDEESLHKTRIIKWTCSSPELLQNSYIYITKSHAEDHDMISFVCDTKWPSKCRKSRQSTTTRSHPSYRLYKNITNRNDERTYKRNRGGYSTRVQGF